MTKFRVSRVDDEDLVQSGRGLTLRTGASRIRLVDRRVLSLGRGEGPVIAGLAAVGTVVSGLFVAQGVLVAAALGRVFDGAQFAEVAPWFAAVLVALGVRSVLVWTYQTRSAAAAGRIAGRLRARLYRQLTDLGPGWAGQQRSGALQTTLVDGVEQIESYFRLFVAQLIASRVIWPEAGKPPHGSRLLWIKQRSSRMQQLSVVLEKFIMIYRVL